MSDNDCALGEELLQFCLQTDEFDNAGAMLDRLHQITTSKLDLRLLGAMQLPNNFDDWGDVEVGKSVHLHRDAPKGWWEAFSEQNQKSPGPSLMNAYVALEPYTLSEVLRKFEPLGLDQSSLKMTREYGIRDTLTCPVGGQWVVVFWSKHILGDKLSQERRALVFMAATFAAIKLQKQLSLDEPNVGRGHSLTARELAVLRSLSLGRRVKETAEYLDLGEETIRTHIKKLQAKLKANTPAHAVAEAFRRRILN